MLSVVFLRTSSQEQDSSVRQSLGVVKHEYLFGGLWTVSPFSFIMAGYLSFVILMYSSLKIQTQAALPPKLTVNPAVITETDSVTLNCQTPSSVSVSQCYFYILSGGTVRSFPCLQTLTGSELLKMSNQRSPAQVKVTCSYRHKPRSPQSNISSITIQNSFPAMTAQALLPPKLSVNPAVITETDSVTLNCQTPSSVSVPQCYFYTLSGGTVRIFPCLQTLTGSELLKMSRQSSPAEVKVKCYYNHKPRSPESDISSITIQNSVEGEPSMMPTFSMNTGVTVYRSSTSTPVKLTSETDTSMTSASMNPEPGYEISGSSVNTPSTKDGETPLKTASEMRMWKFVAVVVGCGVTVAVILLVSVIVWWKRRDVTGSQEVNNREPQSESYDTYHLYSTVSEEPAESALKDMMYSTVQAH